MEIPKPPDDVILALAVQQFVSELVSGGDYTPPTPDCLDFARRVVAGAAAAGTPIRLRDWRTAL